MEWRGLLCRNCQAPLFQEAGGANSGLHKSLLCFSLNSSKHLFIPLLISKNLIRQKIRSKTICFDLARGFLGRFLITLAA
jgi:hypothetical protein